LPAYTIERVQDFTASPEETDTQWEGARIRDVLKAQLGVFESGLNIRITGPYFMLKPTAVQPLGMAMADVIEPSAEQTEEIFSSAK
jgi:two-component sensor histidine kinase